MSANQTLRKIALQTSFEMGAYAAKRGRAPTDCPLTDAECIRRWHDGYCHFFALKAA